MKAKRSHGEGNVRRLKSGKWHAELMDGYKSDGKKNIIHFTADTKAEVLDKIREFKNQAQDNVHVDRKILLSAWADTWYADYETQVQPSTYSGYQFTLNIIKQHMGAKRLCDVLPIDVNAFQDKLIGQGYSLSQIRKCRTMLIQIFDAADENGMIARNPARKAKVLRDKDGTLSTPRQEKDAFTEDEIRLLETELNNDLLGNSILLLLNSGLRVQELLALSKDDIAADGSAICVKKAVKTVAGKSMLGCTKTKKSMRTIPLPTHARSYALYLRQHGGTPLIWSQPGLKPVYCVGSFRRRYYFALHQIPGVRALPPHCCRHTYVTRLQAKGVSIDLIAALAGHSDISTTIGYTHTSLDTLENAVTVLDKPGV